MFAIFVHSFDLLAGGRGYFEMMNGYKETSLCL
jgi:hypothetical protein